MAGKKNITRTLISVIFIVYGVSSVFDAFEALLDLDLLGVLGCALGLLMFTMGIFGFVRSKDKGVQSSGRNSMYSLGHQLCSSACGRRIRRAVACYSTSCLDIF